MNNMKKRTDSGSLRNKRKIFFSVLVVALAIFLITEIYAEAPDNGVDPTMGFDIVVSVGRHDHANLDAQYIHRCKLTPPIVATCLLFSEGPSGDQILAEVEYIITREQYLQLPLRERPNWHDHAVELTPERGTPQCISLPEGLECGALVSILHQTYGKVVNLWDPSDPLPSYPPYSFLVDSPFALEQDLNHDLENIWEVGGDSTSSAEILPDCDLNQVGPCENGGEEENGEENGEGSDEQCDNDVSISYSARKTGEIIQFNDETDFDSMRIDFFKGKIKHLDDEVQGDGGLNARVETEDGRRFIVNAKFDAEELIAQDCETLTWRNSARGTMWESGVGTNEIDFDFIDITYDLNKGEIDAIGFSDGDIVFEFENMIDRNFE